MSILDSIKTRYKSNVDNANVCYNALNVNTLEEDEYFQSVLSYANKIDTARRLIATPIIRLGNNSLKLVNAAATIILHALYCAVRGILCDFNGLKNHSVTMLNTTIDMFARAYFMVVHTLKALASLVTASMATTADVAVKGYKSAVGFFRGKEKIEPPSSSTEQCESQLQDRRQANNDPCCQKEVNENDRHHYNNNQ